MSNSCDHCGKPFEDPMNDDHPDNVRRLYVQSRGKIRIVKTPQGEAPLEVREKWVGVEIPAACYLSHDGDSHSVISKEPVAPRAAYLVLQTEAIKALSLHDKNAALWWQECGLVEEGLHYSFQASEVVEIEPVSPRL